MNHFDEPKNIHSPCQFHCKRKREVIEKTFTQKVTR